MERYQRVRQRNWRTARIDANLLGFWGKYGQIWRFLVQEHGVRQLADLKRGHILDYVDRSLAAGYAVTTVNTHLRLLQAFLHFLQAEGYAVPQALLAHPRAESPRQPAQVPD